MSPRKAVLMAEEPSTVITPPWEVAESLKSDDYLTVDQDENHHTTENVVRFIEDYLKLTKRTRAPHATIK